MKKINICVLVLLIIFTSNILAEVSSTDNLTKILLKIENSSKKINTLKMDYVQNVFYEYTKEREEIAGTLFLKKPRYMYIKQLLPLEQQIYIDDKKILIYTPKDKQVVVDDLKNVIGVYFLPSLILNFGSGWREIKKTNIISLSGEDEKCFIVKINSITGCSDNKKCELKIYVLKMSMCPYKVIVKSEGVLVEIVFKNYSINSVLKRAIFKFIKPEDVETIKLN